MLHTGTILEVVLMYNAEINPVRSGSSSFISFHKSEVERNKFEAVRAVMCTFTNVLYTVIKM